MPKRHLQLARIDPSISAQDFYAEYISKRRPVILTGLLDDTSFKGEKWTNMSYLSKKAGDIEVLVEPIHPIANQYGTDVERVSTTFGEGERVPVPTTQYAEESPDPETVFPPPTNALKDEFPIVPRMMGNLFLQQVNLWLGRSKDGSSSGLHHDFHDNLYCLLQGKKRFVLFSPDNVEHLQPHGTLAVLHPNGLIAYSDIPVRADGLAKRAARLVAAHEEALDDLAELELEEGEGDGEDDFDSLMKGLDDFEASASGLEEDIVEAGPSQPKSKGQRVQDEDDEPDEDEDEDEDEEDGENGDEADAPSEPPSFSRIPTAHLHKYLDIPTTAALPPDFDASAFKSLEKATAPYVVELSAGEMLYLPASWWHEVTSTSSSEGEVHMAFNYWFYPPDVLDNFEAPYADELVWGYLREKSKSDVQGQDGADEESTANRGKRPRRLEEGPSSKRARR
ncbi:Clavaminate synthase-like protein [Epithele typhae]|uniref:Clavaminate synthase-like protein n=1 Tax=Epithele typhae TaxID=378194 RepID=UPI00200834A9|nr:Clavaminate synthase-like protein [Epithele typhae]KAH9926622.1 Clavaminate synthase-like protein [Epithele typhae]